MSVYVAMQYGWEHGELVAVGASLEAAKQAADDHVKEEGLTWDGDWMNPPYSGDDLLRQTNGPVSYSIRKQEIRHAKREACR